MAKVKRDDRAERFPVVGFRAPDPEYVDELRSVSTAAGVSVGKFVRDAIDEKLARIEEAERATTSP